VRRTDGRSVTRHAGSFSGAAKQLRPGQPAVSKTIAQLEDRLGVRLLLRSTHRLMPTEAGRNLLTDAGVLFPVEARRTLEQVERAEAVGRRAGRDELGHIAIGYSPTAAVSGLLSSAIRAYRVQSSDVALHLAEMETPKQLAAIIERRQDVRLIGSRRDYPDGVSALVIRQERLLLALPADHRLAQALEVEALEVEALSGEILILSQYEEDAGLRITSPTSLRLPRPCRSKSTRSAVCRRILAGRPQRGGSCDYSGDRSIGTIWSGPITARAGWRRGWQPKAITSTASGCNA
jgi:DNA-binding transcriptional LysR family regulator